MKKEIIIINQDSGYLTIDLANTFVKNGYSVQLMTGRLVTRNSKLNSGIKVNWIIKYNRSSVIKRITTWVVAFIQIWIKLLSSSKSCHLLIVSNPPLAPLVPLVIKRKFSLYIFDVYPEALYQSGIISKDSIIFRFWERLTIKVFDRADQIFTLTDGMKSSLTRYSHKTIHVIPVWTDNAFFKPFPKGNNTFLQVHGYQCKFIVMYSGNLGRTHNVERIVDIAASITDPSIHFVIIGDGDSKKKMISNATALGLKNISFHPWQEPEKIHHSFGAADITIISQAKGYSSASIPSKTYNFLSAGIPILALTEKDSELHYLTTQYDCGKSFMNSQLREIAEFIADLKNNDELRLKYSSNAIKASHHFTSLNAEKLVSIIENKIQIPL